MTTAAVKPKKPRYYPLTSGEFLHINSTLTDTQLKVYMYWKTLDPFGDRRVEICTKAFAEVLGIHQRTVQLALNKLASLKMIIWEKAKSFIKARKRSPSDPQIAETNTGSSERSQDRERQLELNLEAGSESSHTSSSSFKLNYDQEENLKFQDTENSEIAIDGHNENSEITLEEARSIIRSEIPDEPTDDEPTDDEPTDELTDDEPTDDELNAQSDLEPDIEYDFVPEKPKTTVEVDSFRRRVEDFVLKTLNKTFDSPARRAAYFSKFDNKGWKKWEADYKASLIPQAPYKPYLPEKVEVAAPDSPVAQSAIAFIKSKLGIKS